MQGVRSGNPGFGLRLRLVCESSADVALAPPDKHTGIGKRSEDEDEGGDGDAEDKPVSQVTIMDAPENRGQGIAKVLATRQVERAQLAGAAVNEDGCVP